MPRVSLWGCARRLMGRWPRAALPREARRERGARGETAAARFLRRRGCRVLVRNFRSDRGEIDIVVRDGRELVFVEVKARREPGLRGRPLEAVDRAQQGRIALAALEYLRMLGRPDICFRFDVVEVFLDDDGRVDRCRAVENAFGLPRGVRYVPAADPGLPALPLPLLVEPGHSGEAP